MIDALKTNLRLAQLGVALCLSGLSLGASSAVALPFNHDMVASQYRTGSIMRPKAPGSVAVGAASSFVADKESTKKLVNPIKNDALSAQNGERLYFINCSPCHGDITSPSWHPGVAGTYLGAPNIGDPAAYGETLKSDGYIYSTIHFGGMAIMPALGWKLSPTEHWDIINYLRKVQTSKGSR